MFSEDNVSGKLTNERFMKMSQRYDEEQQQLKKDIGELQRQCDKENDRAFCKEQFLKAVLKFMEKKTLTPTILRACRAHRRVSDPGQGKEQDASNRDPL